MKNTNKLVALILTVLMLAGSTVAYAGTYVSDPVSPSISKPAAQEQPEAAATPAPEVGETPAPSEEPPVGEAPETEAVVTTESENGTVNIRAAASMDADIIGQLSSNDRVTVLGIEGDWTKIQANGVVGYVYSKYLSLPEPEEQNEVSSAVEQRINITANRDLGSLVPGDVLTLSAELIGFEGVDYALNWQVTRDGGDWEDIAGATGTTLTIDITEAHNGCSWRLQAKIGG